VIESLPKQINAMDDVPDHYFEDVHSSIMHQIETEDFVSTLPIENVYQVPDQYFENLVIASPKHTITFRVIWQKKIYAIAAGIALLLICTALLTNSNRMQAFESNGINADWQQVPIDEVNTYISANLDDFEPEMIASDDQRLNIKTENIISAEEAADYIKNVEEIDL
jgi:hypothetical protein